MILDNSTNQVFTSGVKTSHNFSIGDEAMIISILRDKLYSNPKKTLIQEYVSNARDAHRENDCAHIPVEISLPGRFDKNLKIRDYGIGISPDRVANVFVGYGMSTKRSSDKETGGFGIGAKSAWSYVDSFSVETIFEGIKYYYSCYIDESNKGKMDLLRTEATEDKSGTTIVIPVKNYDTDAFQNIVFDLFKFWTVKPYVVGSHKSFTTFNYISSGKINASYVTKKVVTDEVELLKEITIDNEIELDYFIHDGNEGSFLLIDELKYPINLSKISSSGKNVSRISLLNKICFKFNTGIISINPNREDIIYDEKTTAIILSAIEALEKQYSLECTNRINKCANAIEALKEFRTLYMENPFSDNVVNGLLYKGKKIDSSRNLNHNNFTIIKYYKNRGKNKSCVISHLPLYDIDAYYINDEDRPKPAELRLRTLKDSIKSAVIVIQPDLANGFDYTQIKDDVIFEDIPVELISGVAKKSINRSQKDENGKPRKVNVGFEFTWKGFRSNNWEPSEIDIEDGGIYIEKGEYPDNVLKSVCDLTDFTINTFNKASLTKVKANSNWIHLKEALKEWHDDLEIDCSDIEKLYLTNIDDNVQFMNSAFVSYLSHFKSSIEDNYFVEDILELKATLFRYRSSKYSINPESYNELCTAFEFTSKIPASSDVVESIKSKFNGMKHRWGAWYEPFYSALHRYSTPSVGNKSWVEIMNMVYTYRSAKFQTH